MEVRGSSPRWSTIDASELRGKMGELIDFAAGGLAILLLLIATFFVVVIWSAALGNPLF